MMKYLVFAVLLALAGCATDSALPQTPRQGLLAGYETLETYTQTIEQATLSGALSQAQHDALMIQVKQARDDLNIVRNALADTTAPTDTNKVTTYLSLAQQILTSIQKSITAEKSP